MDFDYRSRPWQEYIEFYMDGKLHDEHFWHTQEATEYQKKSLSFSELTKYNGYFLHMQLMDVNDRILTNEFKGKKSFSKFVSALFSDKEDYPMDIENFEKFDDCVVGICSHKRVKDLSEVTKGFDLDEIETLAGRDPDYTGYLQGLVGLVDKAAEQEHGIEIVIA